MDVVKLLLNNGADPNKADIWKETPLSAAVKKGHKDVAKMLLEAGARSLLMLEIISLY